MCPFVSKAQARKIAMLTAQGKFPRESFIEWANNTHDYHELPERLTKKTNGSKKAQTGNR